MAPTSSPVELYADYLRAGSTAPGTIRLRTHYLNRLARHLAPVALTDATPADLLHWIASADWSAETRKSARSSLAGFYAWLAAYGHREDNPAALLPTVRVPRALPKPTPAAVLARALLAATDRDALMLQLAAYAGMRRTEIARVRWEHVSDDGAGAVLAVHGKGGRGRLLPLLPLLTDALHAERRRRDAGQVGTGWRFAADPRSPYVFPGRGGGHIHPETVGAVLTDALGEGWTGHTLRHRFATRAYAGTRDLRAVQELLGHSKPETTARYVAVAGDDLRRAVDAAGAA